MQRTNIYYNIFFHHIDSYLILTYILAILRFMCHYIGEIQI